MIGDPPTLIEGHRCLPEDPHHHTGISSDTSVLKARQIEAPTVDTRCLPKQLYHPRDSSLDGPSPKRRRIEVTTPDAGSLSSKLRPRDSSPDDPAAKRRRIESDTAHVESGAPRTHSYIRQMWSWIMKIASTSPWPVGNGSRIPPLSPPPLARCLTGLFQRIGDRPYAQGGFSDVWYGEVRSADRRKSEKASTRHTSSDDPDSLACRLQSESFGQ